ncbi:hypothetical protein EJV47_07295 [Hymenobacter gummosus]|uniref:Carboxypeptidase regulatory-like domain-containing protein n=1 Tax=Hymenobacter gummosus TaxID=1776032 RepID=A0A3S0HAX4_9BACT|nr:hypothetical protein [Hymenobacter gummosus]RTQ51597.1 hypothetical protein EJV47_07295 [Hymenobacter gummosus]
MAQPAILRRLCPVGAALLLLTSCECEIDGTGVVLDAQTGQPLPDVTVKAYVGKARRRHLADESRTNAAGGFATGVGLVSTLSSDCPDLVVELEKTGYATQQIKNPRADTVRLLR